MSDLIVIVFDRAEEAAEALRAMRALEGDGVLRLADSATVSRDAAGNLHVKNEVSAGAEVGAVVGGAIGAITTFLFPLAGAAVGAAAGAFVGGKLGDSVDGGFVEDVGRSLAAGTSALFLEAASVDAAALRAALEPFTGRVYQTTLPDDLKQSLDKALA